MFRIFKVRVRMGEFGGETEKPTWLYSNMQIVEEIGAYKTRTWDRSMTDTHLVNYYVDAAGKKCCTGNKGLKSSQAFNGQQLSHCISFCGLVIPSTSLSLAHTGLAHVIVHVTSLLTLPVIEMAPCGLDLRTGIWARFEYLFQGYI
jgi:hypothetical protein